METFSDRSQPFRPPLSPGAAPVSFRRASRHPRALSAIPAHRAPGTPSHRAQRRLTPSNPLPAGIPRAPSPLNASLGTTAELQQGFARSIPSGDRTKNAQDHVPPGRGAPSSVPGSVQPPAAFPAACRKTRRLWPAPSSNENAQQESTRNHTRCGEDTVLWHKRPPVRDPQAGIPHVVRPRPSHRQRGGHLRDAGHSISIQVHFQPTQALRGPRALRFQSVPQPGSALSVGFSVFTGPTSSAASLARECSACPAAFPAQPATGGLCGRPDPRSEAPSPHDTGTASISHIIRSASPIPRNPVRTG